MKGKSRMPATDRANLRRTQAQRDEGTKPGRGFFRLPASAFILRAGPGLALAFLALWLAWPALRPGLPGSRPRLDGSTATPVPAPPVAPELSWVLEQREALGLSPAQVEKLRRQEARWERDTRALREALAQASAAFDREMGGLSSNGINVTDLQERAAPVSDLSRRLSEARRACWTGAAAVLTPAQKGQAEAAWTLRGSSGRRVGAP
jgi:hypothetical protein